MNERDLADRYPEPSVAELVDGVARKLVTAIVIAGGLIGLGLWSSRPNPGHYQVVAAEGRVYRINTQSGTVIGCEGTHCAIILRRGQELDESLAGPPAPKQLAPPPQAAPGPAAPPQAAPTPANR